MRQIQNKTILFLLAVLQPKLVSDCILDNLGLPVPYYAQQIAFEKQVAVAGVVLLHSRCANSNITRPVPLVPLLQ